MTPVERLLTRLGTMTDVPAGTEFHRTYAGQRQREAGAWSWWINSPSNGTIASRDLFASWIPVGELLKSRQLALVPARGLSCVDYEVYDAEDAGDPYEFHNRGTVFEPIDSHGRLPA